MKIQLDSTSAFYDALELLGEHGLRGRVSFCEDELWINPQDEDAQEAVYSLLCEFDLICNSDTRLYPGEDMDGDFDSGMASAGHGTDEDYEHGSSDGDY